MGERKRGNLITLHAEIAAGLGLPLELYFTLLEEPFSHAGQARVISRDDSDLQNGVMIHTTNGRIPPLFRAAAFYTATWPATGSLDSVWGLPRAGPMKGTLFRGCGLWRPPAGREYT